MINSKINKSEPTIIHIFDDEKFVDNAIRIFEDSIPDKSRYIVITQSQSANLKFVKSPKTATCVIKNTTGYRALAEEICQSEDKIVFLHALNESKQRLVKLLSKDVIKVWFIWGYDLYNHWKPLKFGIYEKDTLKFINRNLGFKSLLLNTFFYQYKFYKFFKFSKSIYKTNYFDVIQDINIAVPVLPSEMKYVNDINPNLKFAPFAYLNLNQALGENINSNTLESVNILVGNSAAQTNNHIEAFKTLSRIDLGNRKVIVPLSYGGGGDYLKLVLQKGKELLGDNFSPITDFLTLEEYNQLILSCGYAIFNHIRQQAVGNIIAMGYFGTKIFFNKKGVTYNYFGSLGMEIFTLDMINNATLNSHLSEEGMKKNQEILKSQYSEESVRKKVKQLYKITKTEYNLRNA